MYTYIPLKIICNLHHINHFKNRKINLFIPTWKNVIAVSQNKKWNTNGIHTPAKKKSIYLPSFHQLQKQKQSDVLPRSDTEITLYLLEELEFFMTQQFSDNYWINCAFRYINKKGKFEKRILRNCILINPIKSCFSILISPDPLEGIQPLLSTMAGVCITALVSTALLLTVLCSNFRKYNYVHKMILL